MTDDYDEKSAFFNRRTDKTIISKRITDGISGQTLRIATRVIDGQEGLQFAKVGNEIVLRRTPAGRYQIKATFLEDQRLIKTLVIQRYNKNGPLPPTYFAFVGNEIDALIDFISGIGNVPLDNAAKVHLTDEMLQSIIVDQKQARQIFSKNSEIFLQLAQQEDITHDLVAVGYRRKQLQRFDSLLHDPTYFSEERQRLQCKPESVWQGFFQANTWIFGYGLSYQFLSSLDGRKLEQIVRGHDLTAAGKRSDAIMKTRGIISSLCFVEIKRHDTALLGSSEYRPGVWRPSDDLAGGVSQVQATVQDAVRTIGQRLTPNDGLGDPTGEELLNIEPRSCLVIGSLGQFQSDRGINVPKFRSFELYRRHTWRPEIITFDELFNRARFIVEQGPDASLQEEADDDVPF